ncbi:MAG: ATP synthase F1 subunit gamma [Candidatus Eisenbacteria bacterium]|uniref:ATP synthase gamma chain n=1 Tax=Eiseniibacteriota bacterium TaxID=2212470 RepID=A0A956SEK4_UNCEI|nr:ATP synthase F1 subunit gamma [Candidatus Eisenbacteria bacterium]MCB9463250.1 ATP synthase F1 subunit gamma [Candidatus Eisenbacteria bacterium]
MATLKQLRRRIRSIKNTQQITKAMEMVAAAKLRRAQGRALASRPYAQKTSEMLQSLAAAAATLSHPLFEQRPVETTSLVVVASDKGLCGSFNMNVFRQLERQFEAEARRGVSLYPVGRRANLYFGKRDWTIDGKVPQLGDQLDFEKARLLALELTNAFIAGKTDKVQLMYTKFRTVASREVVIEDLLPIVPREDAEGAVAGYIFEPSPERIFDTLLPRYVQNRVLQAMAESIASEHAARMLAMGAATKNAKEVLGNLSLQANRMRQAAITKEILDIVGGAEALK